MERTTTILITNPFKGLKTNWSKLLLAVVVMAYSQITIAQTQNYATPGTYTFTVPAGVTSLTVSAWGAGGAGGGVTGGFPRGGGGGEGGSFVRGTITVTPGTLYTIVVGNSGVGSTGNGTAGGSSSFGAGVFNAIGGVGGTAGITGNTFGTGGSLSNSGNVVSGTSTSNNYGGNGGNASSASTASSGGGGGSAGAGSGGGNGATVTGGTAGTSGGVIGATGRTTANDGVGLIGGNPGAGGSGGRNANNVTAYIGGDGGDGQVTVAWTCASAPNISNFRTSASSPCSGSSSTVTVTSTSIVSSGNYNVYYYLSGANFTATAQLATLSFNSGTDIGTFSTIAIANAGITTITIVSIECAVVSAGNTTNITTNPSPTSVSATTSSTAICTGGNVNLSSSATSNSATATTLLSQNFNSAPAGWTTTNTSTGGTPTNAAWTLRANGYNDGNETFNSNDTSQFYLSNSDAQGSFSTTATTLQSPSFSTLGMSAATLSFYHYYRYNSGADDRGFVDISTDGINWTLGSLTYSSTQGARTGFVQATLNLASFLNQNTVFIRFRYTASFDWYWAIDNVTVTSTPATPAISYAWISTPSGYTSSLQSPTGVSPTVNTSYTITVSNNYGCKATATTATVNVNAVPASGTLTPTPAAGAVCAGTSVSSTATAGSGGAGTLVDELQVSLSGGAFAAYTSGASISTTGQTSVAIRTRRTATGSGCTTSAYNTVTWTVNVQPTASVLSGSATICSGSSANLQVAITGGASPYTVVYSGGTANSYTSGSNITVTPTTTTAYTLTSVTDANGCAGIGNSGTATVAIDSTISTDGGVTWSNGTPTGTKSLIYDGSTGTIGANVTACSLRLINNATVSVTSGFNVTLNGKLTVDSGSLFTLNNNADLLQNTTLSNSGNIVVNRNSSALKRLDYTVWSSPVTSQGVYSFSPFTFANRFYVYRTSTNIFNNADIGLNVTGLDANGVNGTDANSVPFTEAKGYLIRVPWNHPTAATVWSGTFTGVPHNGDYSHTLVDNGAGNRFNLVGNPYPSPIDATAFVQNNNNNSSITGTLYFWRKTNNALSPSYCTWTLGGFVSNGEAQVFDPNDVIQTGQGFFVEGNGSGTVDFTNTMRIANTANQFFRTSSTAVVTANTTERNRIWLNATGTTGVFSQTMVGYMTNATQGVDPSIDGRYINDGDIAFASLIDAVPYAIQGRSLPFESTDSVPMHFKVTSAGTYTIAIDRVDGLFLENAQLIYLKDNLTNTFHILNAGGYVFTSNAGTFNLRFEIVYQTQLANPTFTDNTVVIYSQNYEFVVNSGNAVMKSIKVFDIRGRLIEEKKAINSNQATIKGGLANQVLLVQITSEDGTVVTKKVIR